MQQELVERARRGDHDAFAALAGAAIFRLDAAARLILRDPDQAKDAVQETLVRAWRDLPTLRDPARFDAWLHRLLVPRLHRRGAPAPAPPRSTSSSTRSITPTVGDANAVDGRPRPARTRLQPPRAGGAGPHRPSPLSRPATAGGRRRARDPAGDGEIAPPPGAPVHARGTRRRCPTPAGARGGPPRMTRDERLRRVHLGLARRAGRARRARLPRRDPRPDDPDPRNGRHGRASKGGSPCRQRFASRPCPGSPGCWCVIALSSPSSRPARGRGLSVRGTERRHRRSGPRGTARSCTAAPTATSTPGSGRRAPRRR